MNLTMFIAGDEVYRNCECIKGRAVYIVSPRGKSAHLTAKFAVLQDRSVFMTGLNASHYLYTS